MPATQHCDIGHARPVLPRPRPPHGGVSSHHRSQGCGKNGLAWPTSQPVALESTPSCWRAAASPAAVEEAPLAAVSKEHGRAGGRRGWCTARRLGRSSRAPDQGPAGHPPYPVLLHPPPPLPAPPAPSRACEPLGGRLQQSLNRGTPPLQAPRKSASKVRVKRDCGCGSSVAAALRRPPCTGGTHGCPCCARWLACHLLRLLPCPPAGSMRAPQAGGRTGGAAGGAPSIKASSWGWPSAAARGRRAGRAAAGGHNGTRDCCIAAARSLGDPLCLGWP